MSPARASISRMAHTAHLLTSGLHQTVIIDLPELPEYVRLESDAYTTQWVLAPELGTSSVPHYRESHAFDFPPDAPVVSVH